MSDSVFDPAHLTRSIDLAAAAAAAGNRPFGAVLVAADGEVLAEGRNEVTSAGDITAHAELAAIRRATATGHADRFAGSTMYASGEPCPMCAAACVWAGVSRIVFAASTPAFSRILTAGPHFGLRCAEVVAASDAAVTVVGPVGELEALEVMRTAAGVD
ncbi:MAG TPA: nucleoside deaminase [Nocardia sp.]|uniref:nucleoside deaminase n=1 Tax=Nocardia TaxID=1817 RepID=UPI00245883EC|nr:MULTISPECIES: nucleoside deaminase [Nocardia]HLS78155.1 nucleoside deaminase [Nocardia sp.]